MALADSLAKLQADIAAWKDKYATQEAAQDANDVALTDADKGLDARVTALEQGGSAAAVAELAAQVDQLAQIVDTLVAAQQTPPQ